MPKVDMKKTVDDARIVSDTLRQYGSVSAAIRALIARAENAEQVTPRT